MLGIAAVDESRECFLDLLQRREPWVLEEELLKLPDDVLHAAIAPGLLLGDKEGFYSQIQAHSDHPGEGSGRLTASLKLHCIVQLKDVRKAEGFESLDQKAGYGLSLTIVERVDPDAQRRDILDHREGVLGLLAFQIPGTIQIQLVQIVWMLDWRSGILPRCRRRLSLDFRMGQMMSPEDSLDRAERWQILNPPQLKLSSDGWSTDQSISGLLTIPCLLDPSEVENRCFNLRICPTRDAVGHPTVILQPFWTPTQITSPPLPEPRGRTSQPRADDGRTFPFQIPADRLFTIFGVCGRGNHLRSLTMPTEVIYHSTML